MGMNRSKRDRWPPYEPTRHVLVLRDSRLDRPWQGFVLDWRRHSYRWSALVVYLDESQDDAPAVSRWIPVERLVPLRHDPNLREQPF